MSSGGMEQVFDITTSVVSVEQVVKGNKMPFEVALTGGKDRYTGADIIGDLFLDWKKNIGPKAQAMIGQQGVDARVKVKFVPKNDGSGFFENKELLDIAPQGGLPPMAMPVAGGTPAQPQMPQPTTAVPPQQQPVMPTTAAPPVQAPVSAPAPQMGVVDMMAAQVGSEAARTRQGAVRAACEYVAAQAQAGYFEGATDCDQALRARILDLTAFVTTGSFPGEAKTPMPGQPAEVTPQSIAAQVEGTQVGVPFDTNETATQEEAAS